MMNEKRVLETKKLVGATAAVVASHFFFSVQFSSFHFRVAQAKEEGKDKLCHGSEWWGGGGDSEISG